jgi:flagellin
MALASGFKVNTNTTSFQTYRSYSKSQAGLEQNIERLSSGLRINRAADDTAGQAIGQRMRNQATGMRQAVRNSQQATNYLQTAEGGLNEIHGILSRMRELAVQAASDNLTDNDRFSIELEYSQLKDEVSRIGDSTTYNNMKLIDGSRAKGLTSTGSFSVSEPENTDVINDSTLTAPSAFSNVEFTFDSTAAAGSEVSANDGNAYTYELDTNTVSIVKTGSGGEKLTFDLAAGSTALEDLDEVTLHVGSTAMNDGVAKAKVSSYTANGTYTFSDDGGDTIKLTGPDGHPHEVTKAGGFSAGDEIQFDEAGIVVKLASDYSNLNGSKLVVDDGAFTTIQVGAYNDADQAASVASVGTNTTENRITFNIADATSEGLGISATGLSALDGAQSAINYLDSAIEKVNDERSNIGSLQNRFEFSVSNLQSGIQNTEASRSTILDADFAVEAAGLAKNQILTQSGTAMLAQANQISQNVLSLLK